MADAVTGAVGKVAWQRYGPRPGIQILRFWQGIVEISLRAACIVSIVGSHAYSLEPWIIVSMLERPRPFGPTIYRTR